MPTKKRKSTMRKVRKAEGLPDDGKLLTFGQAGEFLNMSYSSVIRLIKSGAIKPVKIGNFKPRISLSALRTFIAGKEAK